MLETDGAVAQERNTPRAQMNKIEANRQASAWASDEVIISAPKDVVWSVQSDLAKWGDWNPDVSQMKLYGPVAPGTKFRWKAGGVTILSVLQEVNLPTRIAWSGRTLGIRAIHTWSFQSHGHGVLVHTEESFEGLLPRLFPSWMRRMLVTALRKGLSRLKVECERRAGSGPRL